MKSKHFLVTKVMVVFLIFFVWLIAAGLVHAADKTYEWKLQSAWVTQPTMDGLTEFANNVKKASNGRINIKIYQANELVKVAAIRESVQSGAIDMGCSAGAYEVGVIPEADVEFGLPFGWRTWEETWEVWTKYGVGQKVAEAYAEKGLYFITIHPAGEYALMSTKPVRKVEDLKGQKIRTWGITTIFLKSFGVSTATIPGAEQYIALQRGTVDGTVYPVYVLDAQKLKEVIKYVIMPSIISPPTTNLYMNLELYKSLPPELQKALTEASSKHQAKMRVAYEEEGKHALENLKKLGGEIITLDPAEVKKLRQASLVAWDQLAAKSPRMKELVGIMKKFMADKGLLN